MADLKKFTWGPGWMDEDPEGMYVLADEAQARIAELEQLLEKERQRTVDVGVVALDAEPFRKRIAQLERLLCIPPDTELSREEVVAAAAHAVGLAVAANMVLTIYQRPHKPLAMGNHSTEIEVRPARVRS